MQLSVRDRKHRRRSLAHTVAHQHKEEEEEEEEMESMWSDVDEDGITSTKKKLRFDGKEFYTMVMIP